MYDTGLGIAPDRLDAIFEEFERDKRQADGLNEGLGLGLSIVQRYASLIGADVAVRSRLGRGSCFSIVVPVVTSAIIPSGEFATNLVEAPWNRRRVMLLDDNPQALEALTKDLGDHGADVTAFESIELVERALDLGLTADLIIVDYDLSGPETGLNFLERSRFKDSHGMDKIILTGRTDSRTLTEIAQSGIPWLVKPADSTAIASCLAKNVRLT